VQLLADPHASVNQIAKFHRVSTHTVRAIRYREAQSIAERKKSLAAMLANVVELGAERMEATIGKAGLRYAAIRFEFCHQRRNIAIFDFNVIGFRPPAV
jgi:hypothetical protein